MPVKSRKFPEDFRDKRSGKMHEFAQTDMDRGIGYSASEAPVSTAEPLVYGLLFAGSLVHNKNAFQ